MPVYGEVDTPAPEFSNGHRPDPAGDAVTVIQSEVDDYLGRLKSLNSLSAAEAFMTLSAISARLAEIRNRLIRVDNRRFTALRTKEIDPLIDEVDRQFKFHSRIAAVRQMEWDATTGRGGV